LLGAKGGALHRTLNRLPVVFTLALLTGLSSAWAQTASQPASVVCTAQDSRFASSFDKLGLGLGLFIFLFIIPSILSSLAWFWLFVKPFFRWLLPAVLGALLVLILFIALPWAAWWGWIPGETGLFFYPGVDPTYLTCGGVQVDSQKAFWGLIGHSDRVLIVQTHSLILALILACLLWSALWHGLFRLCRWRWGLRALAAR
jgi:hypothetical protein